MAKTTTRKPYEYITPEAPVMQEYIDPKLFGGFGADDAGKVLGVNEKGEWCCKEGGGSGGSAPSGPVSWNDLTDKPFEETITVMEYDGTIENETRVVGFTKSVKVSDSPPDDIARFNGAYKVVLHKPDGSDETVECTGKWNEEKTILWVGTRSRPYVVISYDKNAIVLGIDYETVYDVDPGVYFYDSVSSGDYVSRFEYLVVKPIDEKYLPTNLANDGDVEDAIAAASYVKVLEFYIDVDTQTLSVLQDNPRSVQREDELNDSGTIVIATLKTSDSIYKYYANRRWRSGYHFFGFDNVVYSPPGEIATHVSFEVSVGGYFLDSLDYQIYGEPQ